MTELQGGRQGLWTAGMYLAVLAAAAIVFAPVCRFNFVYWDDLELVVQNPQLHPPTLQNLGAFWTAPYERLYTPAAYSLWWMLSRLCGGVTDASAFHAANLLLHLFAVALVFSILRTCIRWDWAALAGTLLFAVHPLQVEAVAWVSGMNNLLAAVFCLAAIRLYLEFARRASADRWAFYAGATLAFLLALLAKPTAVAAPLMAAVLDVAILRRRIAKVAVSILPWLCAAAVLAILTSRLQPTPPATPILQRPAVALDALAFYLWKLLWPMRLSIDYVRTPMRIWQSRQWIGGAAAVAAVAAAIGMGRSRRAGGLGLGLAVLIAGLLPVLGLFAFDFQRYSTVADRYMYLAMLGAALMLAWTANRWPTLALAAVVGAAICLLAWRSEMQLRNWKNTDALVAHTLQLDPLSTVGNKILAFQRARQQRWQEAAALYRTALIRNPQDGDVLYNLANALSKGGDPLGAIDEYQRAIPLLEPARRLSAMNNLGIAYFDAGQEERAENEFLAVLQIDPQNAHARKNLALITIGVPRD
ncbi:MAG: tetratricopeptide repeat protein [Tepidisphaeraceae bacterium]